MFFETPAQRAFQKTYLKWAFRKLGISPDGEQVAVG